MPDTIEQNWYTYWAGINDNSALISFNSAYAEVAETDQRNTCIQIRIELNDPDGDGLPAEQEVEQLADLGDSLTQLVCADDHSLYVGSIYTNGYRYFYYYTDLTAEQINPIVNTAADTTGYELGYFTEDDAEKSYYWNDLYPTADDWQMISDLRVLSVLQDNGDLADKAREIQHWAYFDTREQADRFSQWLQQQDYQVTSIEPNEEKQQICVRYSHQGTMELGDITSHTLASNRKALELGGEYDGWETEIVRA